MDRRDRSPRRRPTLRRGFSMIELLIVIVIIAILSGFLLQAVNGARQQARIVACVNDIAGLEKAIADFKLKFGVEPPSSLVLYEQASGWATPDAITRSSRAIIREIWPSFDFMYMGDPMGTPADAANGNLTGGNSAWNLNGNSTETDVIYLNGAECLAFFLGGLQQSATVNGVQTITARGFSANPATPFKGYTGTRVGPFTEFVSNRFVDIDADGIYEYCDPLPGQTKPYQYFSSYEGKGYRLNGIDNSAGTPDDETICTGTSAPFTQTLRSVYMEVQSTTIPPAKPFKEHGHQIISPGFDSDYGYGGFLSTENGVAVQPGDFTGRDTVLVFERDNITNIKGGTLN